MAGVEGDKGDKGIMLDRERKHCYWCGELTIVWREDRLPDVGVCACMRVFVCVCMCVLCGVRLADC